MKLKIEGLENYSVETVVVPQEEAPEGSADLFLPVIILPRGQDEEKARIADVLNSKKAKIQFKVGSQFIKVIVKPIK